MDNQISSDLIRGHIDTIILHTLNEQDRFPQQISDAIEEKSEKKYKINQATLYSSLKRLESLKLLTSYWHDCGDGRRKYYKITDQGKTTLEDNLSSWEYSRTVIDKLIDAAESITESSASSEKNMAFRVENTVYPEKNEEKEVNIQEKIVEPEITNTPPISAENFEKDANFRTILNGLIKYSESTLKREVQQETATELKPISETEDENPKKEVLNFNDTVTYTEYNASKINYNGKIDFGDLMIKAAKEGYKISVSSKDSAKSKGNLLINKVNFESSIYVLLLVIAEFIFLSFSANIFNNVLPVILSIISFGVLSGFITKYFINKNKTISAKIMPDTIITVSIVAFNLILVTLVLNFIFGTDFYETDQLLSFFISPILFVINIALFFVLRFYLSKSKRMQLK